MVSNERKGRRIGKKKDDELHADMALHEMEACEG